MAALQLPAMTEKQRLLLSVGLIALVSVALGVFWGFGLKEQGALGRELEADRVGVQAARKELDGLEELRRLHRESGARGLQLAEALPAHPDLEHVYGILEEAERLAGKAGSGAEFTLLGGKRIEDKAKGVKKPATLPYEEIPLELTAEGSWAGFVSFLDSLEHADRLMSVKAFKTTNPSKTNPLLYEYKITLLVYMLKQQPAAPPAGAKK